MNPHADSVQQPSEAELLYLWDTYVGDPTAKYPFTDDDKVVFARAVLARFGTRPAAEPSQSGSAGEAEFTPPAVTDKEMGVGAFTEREAQIIFFCMDQMQDLSDRDWRDHGFRQSTFFNANRKLYALLTQEPKRGHHD